MNTQTRGNVTELEIMLAFKRLGYSVSIPYGNIDRYDLVADIRGQLIRIQCKTSTAFDNGAAFEFYAHDMRRSAHGTRRKFYTTEDVDYFATMYEGKCYLVPVEECHRRKRLRIRPNMIVNDDRIHWAANYELEKVIVRIKEGQIESSDTNQQRGRS